MRLGDAAKSEGKATADGWRHLPLITEGKIDPAWKHTGFGGFVVDNGALRTEPAPARPRAARVLQGEVRRLPGPRRLPPQGREVQQRRLHPHRRRDHGPHERQRPRRHPRRHGASRRRGPRRWRRRRTRSAAPGSRVHHGYEVQIADGGDEFHRTGASTPTPRPRRCPPRPETLADNAHHAEGDARVGGPRRQARDRVRLDHTNVPPRKAWHEPRREPKRPTHGYIGCKTTTPATTCGSRSERAAVELRRSGEAQVLQTRVAQLCPAAPMTEPAGWQPALHE